MTDHLKAPGGPLSDTRWTYHPIQLGNNRQPVVKWHAMTDTLPCAVLWDLDGTLLDSHAQHWRSWEQAGRRHGIPITYIDFQETFGQRNDTILRRVIGPNASRAEITRVADAKEALYREYLREGAALLPGAQHWLDWFAAAGWRQALATSAPPENVEAALDALGIRPYFAVVVHSGDVSHGKPDPEVYLLAAQRLNAPPECCIVIEDAIAGIEGARRAGMRCVAVGPLYATLPADLAVRHLSDLAPAEAARLLHGA